MIEPGKESQQTWNGKCVWRLTLCLFYLWSLVYRYIRHSGNHQACQGLASGGFQQQSNTEAAGWIRSVEEPHRLGIKWHVAEFSSSGFREVRNNRKLEIENGGSHLPGRGNLIWNWKWRAPGRISCVLYCLVRSLSFPLGEIPIFLVLALHADLMPDDCYSFDDTISICIFLPSNFHEI